MLILVSHSMRDLSRPVEIWRTQWLKYLEKYQPQSQDTHQDIHRMGEFERLRLGCMRTHGSLKDVLAMIEEGDQGDHLRQRVTAIREDPSRMQILRELWDDEDLDRFLEEFIHWPPINGEHR
jgi:hypothetical protein